MQWVCKFNFGGKIKSSNSLASCFLWKECSERFSTINKNFPKSIMNQRRKSPKDFTFFSRLEKSQPSGEVPILLINSLKLCWSSDQRRGPIPNPRENSQPSGSTVWNYQSDHQTESSDCKIDFARFCLSQQSSQMHLHIVFLLLWKTGHLSHNFLVVKDFSKM